MRRLSRVPCGWAPRGWDPPAYFVIVMTAESWADPNWSVETRTAALPWPMSAPLGTVVWNDALPVGSVVASVVTVGIPGMLRVNVTLTPGRGCPFGSTTVANSVTGSGSWDRLIE